MDYIFYDTETTGIETAFAQVLQFAAIKTDENLNELERFNIRCRLLPHIIPSPGAMLVTKISPEMLVDPQLPSHYEAFQQIRKKLISWSPAIIVGYNSLAFDEEVLRQAFFQTLQPTYLTNTNGNQRSDVMRIMHAVSIYQPNTISIPTDAKGKETFRLPQLAPANGHNHDHAHEALADVEATIYLAQLAKDRAPDIWKAMYRSVYKSDVAEYVTSQLCFTMTERYFSKTYSWLVTYCGTNPKINSQMAVFDLNFDPNDYCSLSVEQLVDVLNASPKVIRTLTTNKLPIMMPADFAPEGRQALDISEEERNSRAECIRNDRNFRQRVGEALALRYADRVVSRYAEKRMYDGFPSRLDETLMNEFHEAEWKDREGLVKQIQDDRLAEFAYRLMYFERPDILSPNKLAVLGGWLKDRILTNDETVPWMTIKKALLEVDHKLEVVEGSDVAFLKDTKKFITDRFDTLNPV